MRLLNTETHRLEAFNQASLPKYAILSHRWGKNELLYADVAKSDDEQHWKRGESNGVKKVLRACQIARSHRYHYVWIDSCCIDKSSSSELSEAINSMYNWYGAADVCYGFLVDVTDTTNDFSSSEWFRRGWTLQELIAPQKFIFYNQFWERLGTREQLAGIVEEITRIPQSLLIERNTDMSREAAIYTLHTTSIAKRMSWYGSRETSCAEDMAYCLMGIFGVNMPLLYGEGGEWAFIRLQEEIMRQSGDQSILVHNAPSLLSSSPKHFTGDVSIMHEYRKTNIGFSKGELALDVILCPCVMGRAYDSGLPIFLAVLNCSLDANSHLGRPALLVQKTSRQLNRYRKVELGRGKGLVIILADGGLVHYEWQYLPPTKKFLLSCDLTNTSPQRIIVELNDDTKIPDHPNAGSMIVQFRPSERVSDKYSVASSTPKLQNATMIATNNSSIEAGVRFIIDKQQFEWLGVILLTEKDHPESHYILVWGRRYGKPSDEGSKTPDWPWCKLIDHTTFNRSIMTDQPDSSIDVVNGIKAMAFDPSHILWHEARRTSAQSPMPGLVRGLRGLGRDAGIDTSVTTTSGTLLCANMIAVSFLGSTVYELVLEEISSSA